MTYTLQPPQIFDRTLVKIHRNRAAAHYRDFSYLKDLSVKDLVRRLKSIRRTFTTCLDLGCHTGQIGEALSPTPVISADLSERMVGRVNSYPKFVMDEEFLPFIPGSFDLVASALSLQWVNDVPGMLAQIFQCLKPDGLFLASFFGGETLWEARSCFIKAELDISGGVAARFSPLIGVKEAGSLLQRAGFLLPITDHSAYQVTYPTPLALLQDLRHMGETSALAQNPIPFLPRKVLSRALEIYQADYGFSEGRIPATFDIVTMMGWKPGKRASTGGGQ